MPQVRLSALCTIFTMAQSNSKRYGEKLVRRCQAYRNAQEESRSLMITIEVNWMKTEAQITFLKKISSRLDPRYCDVQSRVLSELEGKLKTATLTMDQLITHHKDLQPLSKIDKDSKGKKERDPDFPKMVEALEKMHPKKKFKYAFKKDSLEKIIDDLENWQKRFDPSWMLIMRMADEKIDVQLRDEEMKPWTRRAGFIMAAKGVRDAARESNSSSTTTLVNERSEGSIFKDGNVLGAEVVEVQNSSAVLGTLVETDEEVLVDTMVCNAVADLNRTTKDVRKLARILSNVDPSTFGLLVCRGVIRPSSASSSASLSSFSTAYDSQGTFNPDVHPTFKFLFAIPPSLSRPKSLRTLLLSGGTSVPLNSRFDLAKELTNSVMFVHSSQFVHKNIRPETIIVFDHDKEGGKGLGSSFLVGFEKFRPAEGMTYRVSDGIWQHDLCVFFFSSSLIHSPPPVFRTFSFPQVEIVLHNGTLETDNSKNRPPSLPPRHPTRRRLPNATRYLLTRRRPPRARPLAIIHYLSPGSHQ